MPPFSVLGQLDIFKCPALRPQRRLLLMGRRQYASVLGQRGVLCSALGYAHCPRGPLLRRRLAGPEQQPIEEEMVRGICAAACRRRVRADRPLGIIAHQGKLPIRDCQGVVHTLHMGDAAKCNGKPDHELLEREVDLG